MNSEEKRWFLENRESIRERLEIEYPLPNALLELIVRRRDEQVRALRAEIAFILKLTPIEYAYHNPIDLFDVPDYAHEIGICDSIPSIQPSHDKPEKWMMRWSRGEMHVEHSKVKEVFERVERAADLKQRAMNEETE